MKSGSLFHLAFPVNDLEKTRAFYADMLGCGVGRSAEDWIDFDFAGHQITAHLDKTTANAQVGHNWVDGNAVPSRHFGLILPWKEWHEIAERLKTQGVKFLIKPHVRFPGQPGEQATMFFCDPSGNAIELKSFENPAKIFAK